MQRVKKAKIGEETKENYSIYLTRERKRAFRSSLLPLLSLQSHLTNPSTNSLINRLRLDHTATAHSGNKSAGGFTLDFNFRFIKTLRFVRSLINRVESRRFNFHQAIEYSGSEN